MTTNFCLEIDEGKVKIADIQPKNSHLQALSMGLEQIDPLFFRSDSEEIVEKTSKIVTALLKQLKVVKKNVHLILPDSFSYNQFVEVPILNEKELLSAIKYQADQFIPMPLNEVNLDIEIIYEDQKAGKMLTLIAASPKKIINRIQKLAEYCGLIPDSAETETSAIGRFFSRVFPKNPQSQKSGFMVLNMQETTTSLYFFDEFLGLMTYSHNFQIGYSLFLKELQVNLNIDPLKSRELLSGMGLLQNSSYDIQTILSPSIKNLTSEIEKAVNEITTKRGDKISKIYLVNDAASFKGLDLLFSKYFAIQSEYLNIYPFFEKNNVIDYFKNDLVYFAAAFGGSLAEK